MAVAPGSRARRRRPMRARRPGGGGACATIVGAAEKGRAAACLWKEREWRRIEREDKARVSLLMGHRLVEDGIRLERPCSNCCARPDFYPLIVLYGTLFDT